MADEELGTNELRQLEADGLISGKQYKELPPRVEYTLTKLGKTLCPLLIDIAAWQRKHIDTLTEAK